MSEVGQGDGDLGLWGSPSASGDNGVQWGLWQMWKSPPQAANSFLSPKVLITRLQSPIYQPFHLCTHHPSTPSLRSIYRLPSYLLINLPTHSHLSMSNPSIDLFTYLLIHPSRIYLSIHLSVYPRIHSSTHPATHHPLLTHPPKHILGQLLGVEIDLTGPCFFF